MPISGPELKVQAERFAIQLAYTDSVCNDGWVHHFETRNNIKCGKITGERSSAYKTVDIDWLKNIWPDIRRNYTGNKIYSADEADAFSTPNETLI